MGASQKKGKKEKEDKGRAIEAKKEQTKICGEGRSGVKGTPRKEGKSIKKKEDREKNRRGHPPGGKGTGTA